MTSKQLLGLIFVTGAACAADTFHPLDVRPGMWENTMTVQMSGTPPIPPEVLAKLTPQQRAMMDARIKAQQSQPATPKVRKHCITKEDLAKPLDFGQDRGTCKRTMVTSTSSKQELRLECEMGGIKSNGTVRIEAADAEHVTVASHIQSGDGARAMTIDANGTGKWVGATCKPTNE
jgi:Protein of unknown function (DUF3617)